MLILELDGVGVEGNEDIRSARRAAVRKLQQAIEMLEFRGTTNSCSDSHEGAGDKTAVEVPKEA